MSSFRDELRESNGTVEYRRKVDHSQVTDMDVRIERALRDALHESYPQFGFQGEESGKAYSDGQPYWVVDPIDGTSSFIRGLPGSTIMAAFVQDDIPIVSIIYDFVQDVLFEAYRNGGAFRDGVQIHTHARAIEESAVYLQNPRMLCSPEVKEVVSAGVDVYRPFGASGNTYTLVAMGKIDGYLLLNSSLSVYDNAPGVLLAQEAGALILTESGKEWTVNEKSFAVITPTLEPLLRRVMRHPSV